MPVRSRGWTRHRRSRQGAAVRDGVWLGVAAAVGATLTACGGAEPAPQVTVTVTVTPSGSLRGAKPDDGEGSIAGRRHDVGTIVRSRGSGAKQVLVLDRWSVRGVEDQVVGRDGVRIVPETGDRFSNANVDKLYDVPVGDDLQVVINRCLEPEDPAGAPGMVSRPASLGEFLSLPDRSRVVVLLEYAGGRLVRLETSPRCPVRKAAPGPTGSAAPAGPGAGQPGRAGPPDPTRSR